MCTSIYISHVQTKLFDQSCRIFRDLWDKARRHCPMDLVNAQKAFENIQHTQLLQKYVCISICCSAYFALAPQTFSSFADLIIALECPSVMQQVKNQRSAKKSKESTFRLPVLFLLRRKKTHSKMQTRQDSYTELFPILQLLQSTMPLDGFALSSDMHTNTFSALYLM